MYDVVDGLFQRNLGEKGGDVKRDYSAILRPGSGFKMHKIIKKYI